MAGYERGVETLRAWIANPTLDPGANEATTRLYLDKLLMECLDWPIEAITAEQHQSGEYLDYVLGIPQHLAVVEAKKIGHLFSLPQGMADIHECALQTIRDHSAQNRAAVDQVSGYCQRGGIPVAVLANGEQVICFLGSRQDGVEVTKGRALVFHGLDDILSRFPEFWDALSLPGLTANSLTRRLSGSRSTLVAPPSKLSSRVPEYPGFRGRSEHETDVKVLAGLFLQDLTQQEEVSDDFLRSCYCPSGALSQYALVSREILRTRYQALSGTADTMDIAHAQRSGTLKADIIAGALADRPVVVLGDVGVGKTMFLRHLFRIDASDLLSSTVVCYVNFLTESALTDIGRLVMNRVADAIQEQREMTISDGSFIRAVYNREINEFQRGLFGPLKETDPAEYARQEIAMLASHAADPLPHMARCLHHLRGSRKYDFVVILDNVDHHAPEFQEQIYRIAESLAAKWPAAVFVSLRPSTFYRSRKTGALAAYQPRTFTVSPPRVNEVILKRLEFAMRQLEDTGRLDSFPRGLTVSSESLMEYLRVLQTAFTSDRPIIELVDNLSSGNVRTALAYLQDFVGSGYVDTDRLVTAATRSNRRYTIPIHEFIRAILFGEYSYYDPRSSTIPNAFDVSSSTRSEHFALCELLATVDVAGSGRPSGFAPSGVVYDSMQALFPLPIVSFHLIRAIQSGLLETEGPSDSAPMRITRAGSYLYKRLVAEFSYVDAMTIDTPIVDPGARALIRDVMAIGDRLDRTSAFLNYLDECWGDVQGERRFDWPTISSGCRSQLAFVRARLPAGT